MRNLLDNSYAKFLASAAALCVLTTVMLGCNDDPEPVNEEEVITTVTVVLTPAAGGMPITLQFKDPDGSGSGAPTKTVTAPLSANKSYNGVITLTNDSKSTPVDITVEVEEEGDDHLFCFTPTGSLTSVVSSDTDSKGKPIGLRSVWTTGTAGDATIKIALRHQPGTKTGDCPGGGDTDVEIDFDLSVQ